VAGIAVDVQLPPAHAADMSFSGLVDEAGKPVDDAWKRRRAGALIDAWRASRADALVIELFPFGRRQMRFELVPLLEDAKRVAKRPLVVCSVRDIIQAKPEREESLLELVERHFDRVLVHGDPRVAGLRAQLRLGGAPGGAAAIHRLRGRRAAAHGPRGGRGEVLVSAGGGAVGRKLLLAAMRAREATLLRAATWRVLAGIHCSAADFRELARACGRRHRARAQSRGFPGVARPLRAVDQPGGLQHRGRDVARARPRGAGAVRRQRRIGAAAARGASSPSVARPLW
jgi:predicted glycosyltransferase